MLYFFIELKMKQGPSIAKWLVLLNHFPLTALFLNPTRDFWFCDGSYPASLPKVGGSTPVLHVMYEGAPEIFLHQ